ncbi:hypothetical protein [Bacillus sp. X1(2014)]|uniref:hypothetical protein n=1 Tax=Bacillus sp. X1(2014) TaxID=1565991 RepID=UPI001C92C54A|nr:hypothetical protein [Bacillus sp. X1(2014)]
MRETPAGVRGRGDPTGAQRRGGSPARPRKAKHMERKSTDKFNTAYFFIIWRGNYEISDWISDN